MSSAEVQHTGHEIPLSVRAVGKSLIRVFVEVSSNGINVEGKENLPERPPFIIAFNHFGMVEGLVPHILLPLKHYPYIIIKSENFKGPYRSILERFGFIGINRGKVHTTALKRAIQLLQNGQIIATALEGTRGRGEARLKPKEVKSGIIFLATQNEQSIPVVPMAVWGQNEETFAEVDTVGLKGLHFENWRKKPLFVKIGVPFIPVMKAPAEGKNRGDVRDALAAELQHRILSLLPADYAGVGE